MREAIVILIVIFLLFALTAIRYRRQIAGAIRVWRMFKAMRDQTTNRDQPEIPAAEKNMGRLVNCGKCGKWIPEVNALRLSGNSYFCSAVCLEQAAKAG
jgi:hypothetical protein